MIKKRKKLLFAFIVLVIAVLLFSVVGIITVYLASPQPDQQGSYDSPAYQQAIQEAQQALNASGIQLKGVDQDGNPVDLTGTVVPPSTGN